LCNLILPYIQLYDFPILTLCKHNPRNYVLKNNIILAYRLNDVPLSPDRGFSLQLVAESKYGYKWAKWIVRIELSDSPYRGYWEDRGYNNTADVGGPEFERI
jgi:DMSO/TMAO reductase YedYZ molybdopterin-dependent catalytic subunit